MIWTLGILLSLVLGLYLVAPFLAPSIPSSDTPASSRIDVKAYMIELRELERSETPDESKITLLKSQLLKAAKAQAPNSGSRSLTLAGAISLGLVMATLGLYNHLGSPNFTPEILQTPPTMAEAPQTDYAALLPRYEAHLAESPEDAVGWTLYGRTLMLTGDIQAGLRAYERALELTDTPERRKEYEAAQKFANQVQSGPDAETVREIQNLSKADQAIAIEGMVESLSARLEAEPNDPDGWARLLRARKVLDQNTAAKDDIKRLRQVLPEQAEAIIAQSGWEN